MSDWLKTLRPASFRGVPFHVTEAPEIEVGRRSANHEYASKDEPYSEDMGRKQRSYTIAGGVKGNDFIAQAVKLQEAFETPGAGLLIHPHYGELNVTVEATIKFEGRYASFTAAFKEAGTNTNPTTQVDTNRKMLNSTIVAQTTTINDFLNTLDLSGPAFINTSFVNQIQSLADTLSDTAETLISLVSKPAELAQQIFSSFDQLQANQFTTSSSVSVINNVTPQSVTAITTTDTSITFTPSQQRIANNTKAVSLLTEQAAAVSLAKTALNLNFTNQIDADTTTQAVAKRIEAVSWQSADDSFKSLTDLRINLQQDMQARIPQLPDISLVELPQALPSLVVAYQQNGSIDNEQSIIERNSIKNPGFIVGEIEVINA
jgi:prophage DNA circulation protein